VRRESRTPDGDVPPPGFFQPADGIGVELPLVLAMSIPFEAVVCPGQGHPLATVVSTQSRAFVSVAPRLVSAW
jgi:hypothetical protein